MVRQLPVNSFLLFPLRHRTQNLSETMTCQNPSYYAFIPDRAAYLKLVVPVGTLLCDPAKVVRLDHEISFAGSIASSGDGPTGSTCAMLSCLFFAISMSVVHQI